MSNRPNLEDVAQQLSQAEGTLSAIVDQACLNGADVVQPAALIAAHNLTHQASAALETIMSDAGNLPDKPTPIRQSSATPAIDRRQTARLTDAADEAEAGIRELMAALDIAAMSDADEIGSRDAFRGFAKLARKAHEDARDAARRAEDLHRNNRPADAA